MATTSKTLEELTCPECGTVYKGKALKRLSRTGKYQRIGGFVFESAWCVCTDERANGTRPTLSFPVEGGPWVIGSSYETLGSDRYLFKPVRRTRTQLVMETEYQREIRFNLHGNATGSNKEYIRDDELELAIKLCEKGK